MKEEKRPLSIRTKIVYGFIIMAVLLGAIVFLSLEKNITSTGTAYVIEGESELDTSMILIILVAILIVYVISFGFFFSKRIFTPIKDLNFATQELKKKNFKTRVNIKTKDELGDLGKSFNNALESLEKMEQDRKRLEKAKIQFLRITSHELRTELTPLRTQVEMLLKEYFGKLNPKQKKSLNVILESTGKLDKVIEDIIELSRIQTAKMKFKFRRTDISKTIKSIVDEMGGFMPEKKIKITSIILKLPNLIIDPDRIGQVLRNLINNAIKFSPKNSEIKISTKIEKGNVILSVKDEGQGINKEDQKRIFEPFFQGQSMYKGQEGSGLGLAISKGIVEAHGGKIFAESKQGKGSNFYFTIPIKNKV